MTKRELSFLLIAQAALETITEMGADGAPLDHLYAALMGTVEYDTFTRIIAALQEAQRIRVSHHVAYAIVQR
jgi:hypothetical protein